MNKMNSIKEKRLFFALCLTALFLLFIALRGLHSGTVEMLEISFLDVGNGDAAMLRTPENDVILIDGGEASNYETAILPALSEAGRIKVDSAVVSHFHSDHAGGIQKLIDNGLARTLYMPDVNDDDIKSDLINNSKKNNIHYEYLSRNDKLEAKDKNLKIDVLFPDTDLFFNDANNENNDSLVLRVSYFDTVFLFTGDLESDAERVLVNSGSLASDVLKVGHHGSKTSSSAELLNAVKPTFAVISVGENNRYGHPAPQTLKNLKLVGAKILRTDQNGKIVFFISKSGIRKINMERMTAESQEPEETNGNT